MEHTKHACMLPKPPGYEDELHPTANCWQRMRIRWRNCLLPCNWHHGSLAFLRSNKSLELERQRQLAMGHCLIWHPYSPAKFYYECFMWVTSAFAVMYAPFQVFFNCPNPADPVILTTDFLMILDILVKFCSGYNDENNKEIVLEPKKIALKYLKGSFVLDLLTAMPWQLYQPFKDCRYPSHTIFYPVKLLRHSGLLKKRESVMEQLEVPYFSGVLLTVAIRMVLFFNWMTYWQYQVPAICVHYYDLNNLGKAEAEWLQRLNVDPTVSVYDKYITNLYHVVSRCVGAGYAIPVRNHVLPEMIQNCITGIVSLVFLIYCFTTVVRLVLCWQSNFMYDGAVKDLDNYMDIKRLPKSLKDKIRLFINYKFGGKYMSENSILNTINDQIKQDINMHTCRRLVVTASLFKGFPITLINAIIFSLKQEVFIPGQEVMKRGHLIPSMYFIYYGTVAYVDENGTQVKHLRDGAHFGEAALLRPGELATTTVIALEISEIYALTNEDYNACMQLYPHIKQRLTENHYRLASRTFPGRR